MENIENSIWDSFNNWGSGISSFCMSNVLEPIGRGDVNGLCCNVGIDFVGYQHSARFTWIRSSKGSMGEKNRKGRQDRKTEYL